MNVKGPTFNALHELFDQIQARVDTFTDDIAERAVSLAGFAEGTLQSAAKNTNLPPFPTKPRGWAGSDEGCRGIAWRRSASLRVRQSIRRMRPVTKTPLICSLACHVRIDKDLWFVEAHLQ